MSDADLNVFIIAGEPSGDRLAAELMAGLKAETGGAVRFTGVGGPLMAGEGLDSLFPIDRLSVMGLLEVLPRLPELTRRIRETARAVADAAPDVLITVDSPDFCIRVAKAARKLRPGLRTVHYVAPSVWAWRPGRAAKMARVIDHVLALLPFEPPFMQAAGMSCDFVGHPAAGAPEPSRDARAALRARLGVEAGTPLLSILPGSRAGEVRRHAPLFREVLERLAPEHPGLRAVIPTVGPRVAELRAIFDGAPCAPAILDPGELPAAEAEERKRAAFAESVAALAVSGTVSLELAAAGTPMAVAYRANAATVFLARRLLKVRYASLVNIMEDAPIIPEYLFDRATAPALAGAVANLIDDPEARAAQADRFDEVMRKLGRGEDAPGLRAARSVLTFLR